MKYEIITLENVQIIGMAKEIARLLHVLLQGWKVFAGLHHGRDDRTLCAVCWCSKRGIGETHYQRGIYWHDEIVLSPVEIRVAQYKANPKASIYFCDAESFKGMMLRGTMEVLE